MMEKSREVLLRGDAPLPASKLPTPIRFPLIVVLSLSLSSLLYSFAAEYTAGELANVSRSLNEWWEVALLVGVKTFELGLGWYLDYDGYDLAALTLLSHGPPLYLLATFYDVRASTVLSSLAIDTLTTYLPFRLLRPLSLAHAVSRHSVAVAVPNEDIVTDWTIQALTTALAAGIYSVTLYTACASYLPVTLVTYFDNIPSIAAAHSATAISLVPLSLVLGLAARSFVFTPATAAMPSIAEARASAFNPATASLGETFSHNVWNFDVRTKVVIKRTATLMLISGINTFVQCYMTIEGVEAEGAVGYAAIWVVAAGLAGASLGFVGAA